MKKRKAILLAFSLLSLWLLVNTWPSSVSSPKDLIGQPASAFDQSTWLARLDELRQDFGRKKHLPEGFELQALIALSYFPELRDVPIRFRIWKSSLAHTSRPDWSSLIWPWQQRSYTIGISRELDETLSATVFRNLPFNAQIGVLGHELSHVVDYERKANTALMGLGLQYLREDFQACFEQQTDIRTIERGLGYQLLAWSRSVHHLLAADGRGHLYLEPDQILRRIQENDLYDQTHQGFFNNFEPNF